MEIRLPFKWILTIGLAASFILAPALRGVARSESDTKPAYGDLTQKEHCMRNIALSYANQDIEGFKALLHEDYVYIIDETKTRSRQYTINAVNFMFDNATRIDAEISDGDWEPITTFAQEPCPGCWATNREFTMRITTPDVNEKEIRTPVRFIVAPVEESGAVRYKLRGEASPELKPETAQDSE